MSNYTKLVNFAIKDTLNSGDSGKLIRGTEINTEFNNIATAISSKADINSPDLTGDATAVNLTVTGILEAVVDGGTY